MSNSGTTHILAGELAKDYSKLSTEEKNKLAKTLFGISDKVTSESTPKPTVAVSDHPISNTINVLSNALSSITDHAVTSDTASVSSTDHAVTSDTASVSSTDHAATVNTVPNEATSDSNVVSTHPTPATAEPSVVSVSVPETKEITISAVKVSTFYGEKAMKLPEGIVANAAEIDAEHGKVRLKDIGRVVPANTGVILTGEPGTYTLTATTEAAQEFGKNDLKGTLTGIPASEIAAASEVYYALSVNDGQPCFGVLERDLPAGKAYFTVPKSTNTQTQFQSGFTISNQD